MGKTIHSIAVHDLPNKWEDLIPGLLGHIYFNANPDKTFLVQNVQPGMSKLYKQYKYTSFFLPLPLLI